MKSITTYVATLAMGFALSTLALKAAEGGTGTKGAPSTPEEVAGLVQQGDNAGKPDRAGTADELKDAIKDFQQARADFLKAQAELRKGLGQATSEERAQIREQLKALVGDWVRDQKQYRDRIREELRDMREVLRNARDKQLDEVKGKGKGGKGRD